MSTRKRLRRRSNSSKKRLKRVVEDEDWIVNDEETDEDDVEELLYEYNSFQKIVVEGTLKVLNLDRSSRRRIEDNVRQFLTPIHEDLTGSIDREEFSNSIKRKLKALQAEIDDDEPTLQKIISSKISREDKKYCLKLYKVYSEFEEDCEDKIRIGQFISNKILFGHTVDESELETLEGIEKDLMSKCVGIHTLKERILTLNADEYNKLKIFEKYKDFETLSPSDSNYHTIKEWLEWAVKLPFNRRRSLLPPDKSLSQFLPDVRAHFDKNIFGMREAKDEFIVYLHSLQLGLNEGKNILLEGVCGTGKTLVAKACSEALGWPFYRISCGGLEEPSLIRGQDTAWVGSSPSVFVQALCYMKCGTGLLLLDEIDKMSHKSQEALLGVLDHTTNSEWSDGFLSELKIDLRGLMIVGTANNTSMIIGPLRDRFQSIHISPYDRNEKKKILTRYVLPSTLESRNLDKFAIKLDSTAIDKILEKSSSRTETDRQGGMREAKMILTNVISRAHLLNTIGRNNVSLGFSLSRKCNFPLTLRGRDIDSLYSPISRK